MLPVSLDCPFWLLLRYSLAFIYMISMIIQFNSSYYSTLINCLEHLICERQRALYGIKCVLGIFWQTWLTYWRIQKISALCKHVPCNTLTHSTNEDLLNIKRKGDPKSRTLSRTSDTTETRNPCVIKVILLACFTYIDIFFIY